MWTWWVGILAVGLPMLLELRVSRRNERTLRGRGAVEPAGDPYEAMSLVYPLSFVAMALEPLWRGTPGAPALWGGALAFVVGKALKYWAIRSLGDRWSFRVLTVADVPLVTSGPYRWMRHPNYVGLGGEYLGALLWFGAWVAGPLALAAFGALLWLRVRVEDAALRSVDAAARGRQA